MTEFPAMPGAGEPGPDALAAPLPAVGQATLTAFKAYVWAVLLLQIATFPLIALMAVDGMGGIKLVMTFTLVCIGCPLLVAHIVMLVVAAVQRLPGPYYLVPALCLGLGICGTCGNMAISTAMGVEQPPPPQEPAELPAYFKELFGMAQPLPSVALGAVLGLAILAASVWMLGRLRKDQRELDRLEAPPPA